MMRRNERNLDNIPVGALGIIALDGCQEMGNRVDEYLAKWRHEDGSEAKARTVPHIPSAKFPVLPVFRQSHRKTRICCSP